MLTDRNWQANWGGVAYPHRTGVVRPVSESESPMLHSLCHRSPSSPP